MHEGLVTVLALTCFIGAAVACLSWSERMGAGRLEDRTHNVVRLTAGIFVVMTSLVLGLLINSAKDNFQAIDHDVHAFATELILLDRTLRLLGPDASDIRRNVGTYVQRVREGTWPTRGAAVVEDRAAELLLDEIEAGLKRVAGTGTERIELWRDAQQHLDRIIQLRWSLIARSDGSIPPALVALLIGWLTMVFASFGFAAPRNRVVVTTFVVSAFLVAGSLQLLLDMDRPFNGSIRVSAAPVQRALDYMAR